MKHREQSEQTVMEKANRHSEKMCVATESPKQNSKLRAQEHTMIMALCEKGALGYFEDTTTENIGPWCQMRRKTEKKK